MNIETNYDPGATLYASIQRVSDGFYWQNTIGTPAWAAGSTPADIRVDLTEQSSPFLGLYKGSNAPDLGSPGEVVVRIHDSDANEVIGGPDVFYVESNEALSSQQETADASTLTPTNESQSLYATAGAGGTATYSPQTVSEKRTFFVGRQGNVSSSVVTLTRSLSTGKPVTLAVEFPLNEGADIDANATHIVTVVGQATLTVSNIAVRGDGRALHFDIPSDSAVDEYVVTAEVQTVDSNSIPVSAKLVIE